MNDIWLFGGIEKVTKKRFVVALTGEIEEKRDKETLVPLILKYIKPGTTIYSDAWGAYIFGEIITRIRLLTILIILWIRRIALFILKTLSASGGILKSGVGRPGVRSKYLHQYLARYLFVTGTEEKNLLHSFLTQAALLYPPQGTKKHSEIEEDSDTEVFKVAETE